MSGIPLTPEQEQLRNSLYEEYRAYMGEYPNRYHRDMPQNKMDEKEARMKELAHQLHLQLKESGYEPKHNKNVLRNRGVPPEDPKFYAHHHAVEDLLKLIEDPHLNDEPDDRTVGEEFQFKVYSEKWEQPDIYKLKRMKDGWYVEFLSFNGPCNKKGYPFFTRYLNYHGVSVPNDIGDWLGWLWDEAHKKGLTKEDVQNALDSLSNWLKIIEDQAPKTGIWENFR